MKVLFNIATNSLKRRNFRQMAGKVLRRITEFRRNADIAAAASWCAERVESWPAFAAALDPLLWNETEEVCAVLGRAAQARIDEIGLDRGGGGHYPLLYFLTRYLRALTVVETGVAAGWSSQAILTALASNGAGHLYSSDFPFFRMKSPEQYVGCVVEERLRDRWTLLIDGDRNNLPEIAKQVDSVDLFHFDSDKSYSGREFVWRWLKPRLAPGAVVLFDDIQDNFHFRDLTVSCGRPFRVFSFGGKYVGMMGLD